MGSCQSFLFCPAFNDEWRIVGGFPLTLSTPLSLVTVTELYSLMLAYIPIVSITD